MNTSKLQLSTETLRVLDQHEPRFVNGGKSYDICTADLCPTKTQKPVTEE